MSNTKKGTYPDSNTNLYQFGVRYYDPSLGRWTQQDPVAGSLFDLNSGNRYTYASDDPINKVDPSGKCDYLTAAILVVGILAAGFVLIALTPEGIPSAALIITALTTPVTAATGPVLAFLGTLLGFVAAAASALQCAATLGS